GLFSTVVIRHYVGADFVLNERFGSPPAQTVLLANIECSAIDHDTRNILSDSNRGGELRFLLLEESNFLTRHLSKLLRVDIILCFFCRLLRVGHHQYSECRIIESLGDISENLQAAV